MQILQVIHSRMTAAINFSSKSEIEKNLGWLQKKDYLNISFISVTLKAMDPTVS